MDVLGLTEDELEAKAILFKSTGNYNVPIDSGNISDIQLMIPEWFDEKQFKLGQKYFTNNRYCILASYLSAFVLIIGEPAGLDILVSTDKSNTVKTSKTRYAETILHILTWFEFDLTRNSELWKSINRIRRLHLSASNAAIKNNFGIISQTEVSLTLFAFMGPALVKPHLIGIKYDCDEDREAFIHFWAVIGHMIGIHDENNFCLKPLKVVKIYCNILLRYVFIPMIQFEPKLFKHMTYVFMKGMYDFFPLTSYESQLFLARRLCGVPGYQYDVDLKKEKIIKDIFTKTEINQLLNNIHRNTYSRYRIQHFSEKIYIYDTIRGRSMLKENNNNVSNLILNTNGELMEVPEYLKDDHDSRYKVTVVSANDWQRHLNYSKFNELSAMDRHFVRLRCLLYRSNTFFLGKIVTEWILDFIFRRIKKYINDSKLRLY